MRAGHGWPRRAGLSGLLVLVCLGCVGKNDEQAFEPLSGSGIPGSGIVRTTPQIEGAWHSTTTLTGNTCGSGILAPGDEQILEIIQSDTSLSLTIFSPCGTLLATGNGTVSLQDVMTLNYDRSIVVTDTCRLRLRTTRVAAVRTDLERVGGNVTLNVSGIGDCGPGLPCQISGTFLAEKCPPVDCAFRTCQP